MAPSHGSVPGFGVEQTPYGMQTQNFPKGGLLDNVCLSTAAPGGLSAEQEFQMFPKSRLNAVSVGYCPVSQDFTGGSLSLIPNGSGKKELPADPFSRLLVRTREPRSHRDTGSSIHSPAFDCWSKSRTRPSKGRLVTATGG